MLALEIKGLVLKALSLSARNRSSEAQLALSSLFVLWEKEQRIVNEKKFDLN